MRKPFDGSSSKHELRLSLSKLVIVNFKVEAMQCRDDAPKIDNYSDSANEASCTCSHQHQQKMSVHMSDGGGEVFPFQAILNQVNLNGITL